VLPGWILRKGIEADGPRPHHRAMAHVTSSAPPEGSLIAPFAGAPGHYADAFRAAVPGDVTLPGLIRAFYTTPLFRAERLVLSLAGLRGTDTDIAGLADGARAHFAAWTVEARRSDEILLADVSGRTKSWLKVARDETGTRVWFGSVIVPLGGGAIGPAFTLLVGPHRVYSRALLAAACRRLAGGR
jgi:hypothetical protein